MLRIKNKKYIHILIMSSYAPPIENVAIFDSALFVDGDDYITQDQADARYLRFPTAQGTETLQAIIVNGTATMNNLTSVNTTLGQSNTATFSVLDDTSGSRQLKVVPHAGGSGYNPATIAGSTLLVADNTSNNSLLQMTSFSSTNSSVVVGTTYTKMGSGGTTATPTTSIECNGSTNTMTLAGTTLTINNTNVNLTSLTSPTSSATQPAASDSSTKIPTTAWVQTAISSGSANITPNSVQITPTTPNLSANTSGIVNLYNMGAFYALSGNSTILYTSSTSPSQYTPDRALQIRFTTADGTNNFNLTQPVTFTLNCFFYDGSSYGETSCQLMIFPAALTSNWGSFGATSFNINNNIGGNTGFYSAGRQYWTSNQQLSGFSGSQGWLQGNNNATGVYTIYVYFTMWSGSTWTYWCRAQATNGASAASPAMGIQIFS
jgi:hypothetical protein